MSNNAVGLVKIQREMRSGFDDVVERQSDSANSLMSFSELSPSGREALKFLVGDRENSVHFNNLAASLPKYRYIQLFGEKMGAVELLKKGISLVNLQTDSSVRNRCISSLFLNLSNKISDGKRTRLLAGSVLDDKECVVRAIQAKPNNLYLYVFLEQKLRKGEFVRIGNQVINSECLLEKAKAMDRTENKVIFSNAQKLVCDEIEHYVFDAPYSSLQGINPLIEAN
jgi:hypothetical protein